MPGKMKYAKNDSKKSNGTKRTGRPEKNKKKRKLRKPRIKSSAKK